MEKKTKYSQDFRAIQPASENIDNAQISLNLILSWSASSTQHRKKNNKINPKHKHTPQNPKRNHPPNSLRSEPRIWDFAWPQTANKNPKQITTKALEPQRLLCLWSRMLLPLIPILFLSQKKNHQCQAIKENWYLPTKKKNKSVCFREGPEVPWFDGSGTWMGFPQSVS